MDETLQRVKKFCGLGVVYTGETPYGAQVQIIQTPPYITPAQQAGLSTGDIIQAVRKHGEWLPVTSPSSFSAALSGMEGEEIPLRIVRGVPMPSNRPDYHTRADEKPRWEGVPVESLETTAIRARIYPLLPPGTPEETLEHIPWRSHEELLECLPMSQLPVEESPARRLAELRPDDTPSPAGHPAGTQRSLL